MHGHVGVLHGENIFVFLHPNIYIIIVIIVIGYYCNYYYIL